MNMKLSDLWRRAHQLLTKTCTFIWEGHAQRAKTVNSNEIPVLISYLLLWLKRFYLLITIELEAQIDAFRIKAGSITFSEGRCSTSLLFSLPTVMKWELVVRQIGIRGVRQPKLFIRYNLMVLINSQDKL